jgi:hypothetical protein
MPTADAALCAAWAWQAGLEFFRWHREFIRGEPGGARTHGHEIKSPFARKILVAVNSHFLPFHCD